MDPAITTTSGEIPYLITQYGLGGLIFAAFMFLLKWVLKQQEKILDGSKDERMQSQTVIQGYQKTLDQMNIQSGEFHKQVTEAHNYQRNEHEKMLEGLNNVCLVTRQHADCLTKIKDNLDEQGKALARINGYQHN